MKEKIKRILKTIWKWINKGMLFLGWAYATAEVGVVLALWSHEDIYFIDLLYIIKASLSGEPFFLPC
tara:strand:+ start:432 stop:632 length:201 start_codon:yes stop_codon:yes gene_type:complete